DRSRAGRAGTGLVLVENQALFDHRWHFEEGFRSYLALQRMNFESWKRQLERIIKNPAFANPEMSEALASVNGWLVSLRGGLRITETTPRSPKMQQSQQSFRSPETYFEELENILKTLPEQEPAGEQPQQPE